MENASTTKTRRLIVHLVHGTWPHGILRHMVGARRQGPNSGLWFEEGSEFRRAVQESAGPREIEFVSFKWPGNNSFEARNVAAQNLREHLARWLSIPDTCHAIIAHSHGGTVAFQALAGSPATWPERLSGLYTMATPFISLRKEAPGSYWRSIAPTTGPIVLLSALGAWWMKQAMPYSPPLVAGLLFLAIFAMGSNLQGLFNRVFDALFKKVIPLLAPSSVTMPCHITAFRSPGDEASLSIAAAQFVDLLMSRVLTLLLVKPLYALFAPFIRLGRWKGSISLSVLVGLIGLLAGWAFIHKESAVSYLLSGPLYALLLALAAAASLSLAIVVFLLPGLLLLRLAAGPEVLRSVGRATVVTESIPSGVSSRLEFVEFDGSKGPEFRSRHSLHESKWLRRRLGELLREAQ